MPLLGIGQSALMAAYAQLQTTGHNIANANTPGYSRQEAVFATAGARQTGGGFLGWGVDLVTVQRRYDRFLASELASSTAASAADTARAAHLERLQRVLADTDHGVGAALDDLNVALADVVNRASDPTAREVVVQRAETLAQRIRSADAQMLALGRDADEQIAHSAGRVNELLRQFAGLNERIAAVRASGHTPNDLLDERDRVLLQLNGYLKVDAHEQDDGTMSLFAAGGQALLVGSSVATLEVSDTDPPSKLQVFLKNGTTTMPMQASSFGGGSIGGWMRFRDEDLHETRARFSELAEAIAETYNDRQALGTTPNGVPGQAMFSWGSNGHFDFRSLLVSGTQLASAYPVAVELDPNNSAEVTLAAFDVDGAIATTPVAIRFDGNGNYELIDSGGNSLGAGTYSPGSIVVSHEGWSLTLRGAPQDGDVVHVVPNANPGTDGRNARRMIFDSEGLTDSFATIIGDLGARTQSAQASRTASAGLLSNAQAAHAEHSAVNLDEEAARLLQYQQMYQPAAKVMQAAQEMFDTLLAAAR